MPKQTATSFVPREMLARPSAFGNSTNVIAPAAGISTTDSRYRAAMVQHVLSFRVREQLAEDDMTLKSFMEPLSDVRGLGVERMGRVLRGAQMATIADLAFWAGEYPGIARFLAVYVSTWGKDATS